MNSLCYYSLISPNRLNPIYKTTKRRAPNLIDHLHRQPQQASLRCNLFLTVRTFRRPTACQGMNLCCDLLRFVFTLLSTSGQLPVLFRYYMGNHQPQPTRQHHTTAAPRSSKVPVLFQYLTGKILHNKADLEKTTITRVLVKYQ